MQSEELKELISVDQFDRILLIGSLAWFVISLGAAVVIARRRPSKVPYLLTGLLTALFGPGLYGLWRFYLWRIRIDLDRDFVGLHRVDVLLGNLLIFCALGLLLGVLIGLYFRWFQKVTARQR
ncbi:MAG: hypothetical protein NZ959_00910 [Armatimonadetes bacterium]|nr:hypothetical protein [Armatimonadota bacterium]MDW8121052.1 hypothetical protein [Armatimonadota bacterium]